LADHVVALVGEPASVGMTVEVEKPRPRKRNDPADGGGGEIARRDLGRGGGALVAWHPSISGLPEIVFSMQVGNSRLAWLARPSSLAPQDDDKDHRHPEVRGRRAAELEG